MKHIVKISSLFLVFFLVSSCSDSRSLQQFLVKQQERPDIISFDLSSSLLNISEKLSDKEDLETLHSLQKINVLAYKIKDSIHNSYSSDIKNIKNIFKSGKYEELMRFGNSKRGMRIYLLGDENTIDEMVLTGNSEDIGWFIARVLGKDMQPEKIIKLLKKLDFDDMDIDTQNWKELLEL